MMLRHSTLARAAANSLGRTEHDVSAMLETWSELAELDSLGTFGDYNYPEEWDTADTYNVHDNRCNCPDCF